MPIYYTRNHSIKVGVSHWTGSVNDESMLIDIKKIVQDSTWDYKYDHIIDLSSCDLSEVTPIGMKRLAQYMIHISEYVSYPDRKIAVITDCENSINLFQIYRNCVKGMLGKLRIFDSIGPALHFVAGGDIDGK